MKAPYSGIATYSARKTGLAPIAAATDIFTISGSATKSIQIIGWQISGVATAVSFLDVLVLTRSTANSGGTAQTDAKIGKYALGDPSPTASIKYYNSGSNPTVGTLVTTYQAGTLALPASGSADELLIQTYGTNGESPIILTGTASLLCFNLNGQTIPTGTSLDIEVIWKEI